jgi:hypothetical protein
MSFPGFGAAPLPLIVGFGLGLAELGATDLRR